MKPILFNTAMVQSILEGRKTTTRRIIKTDNDFNFIGMSCQDGKNFDHAAFGYGNFNDRFAPKIKDRVKAPYLVNDILYVRETWCKLYKLDDFGRIIEGTDKFYYRADGYNPTPFNCFPNEDGFNGERDCPRWRPSIHMPKEVARIFLKVTNVRVERLQNMKYGDYQNEGAQAIRFSTEEELQKDFIRIWNSTVKKTRLHSEGWDGNPWVWVIEFERCEKPNEG